MIIAIDGMKYAEYEVNFDKGGSVLLQGYNDQIIERLKGNASPNGPMGATEVE